MKNIILFILLAFFAITGMGQVGQTLSSLKAEYGSNFTDGFTDPLEDNSKLYYVLYNDQLESTQSGTYTRVKSMYFESNNPDEICLFWRIIEPSSEANSNIKYFNKELVKLSDLKWKDYETNLIYTIVVEDGLCVVTCFADFENL